MLVACGRQAVRYQDVTLDQIRKEVPFSAVVEVIQKSDVPHSGMMVMIGLRKEDGSRVGIYGLPASEELSTLAAVLKRGMKYRFPDILEETSEPKK